MSSMRKKLDEMGQHTLKLALVGGATAVVLAAGSAAAVAAANGTLSSGNMAGAGVSSAPKASSSAPTLPGSVVDVKLTDMGTAMPGLAQRPGLSGGLMGSSGNGQMMGRSGSGQMMGGRSYGQMMGSGWRGRMMQVRLSLHTVPAGTVSLRVSDTGAMVHELVVLPLADGAQVGQRSVGSDGTVDEGGSLGEVSNNGGAGAGDGLRPGGTGWTTLQLQPGHYELVCNLPGHYAAGMYAELQVTK